MEIKKTINPANGLMSSRCSIRNYDTSVKINREEMTNILQDALTAPSSFNLQPWRFVVIDTQDGKKIIEPYMMFNHTQWETSAAVIAIFGDLEADENLDKILSANIEHHLMDEERKTKMTEMIKSYRASFSEEKTRNGVMLDCGFVSMQLMLSAKAYGYDTNPIGGYMKKEFTEAVGLDPKRYEPVILLTIGKAAEDSHDSVRLSVDEVTKWL